MRAPSPPGELLWGHLRERRRDALGLFQRGAEQYGTIVKYRMGFFHSYLLTDPAFIKHVLQDNHANYRKGPIFAKMEVLIGKGLITSEGDHWKKQRRLVQPVFQRERLLARIPAILEVIDRYLDEWAKRREPFDVHREMTRLTMDVICATLFGRQSVARLAELSDAGQGFVDEVSREVLTLFSPLGMLLRRRGKQGPAIKRLHAAIDQLIAERRNRPSNEDDFLSLLMSAKSESGQTMTEVELKDEVLTLFVAGHETTALGITWALYLLSGDARVQEKVRAEEHEDIGQLRYTRAVLEESMRLYPPVWSFPRQAIADDDIGGYRIPRGSFTVLSPYVMQRHPRYWRSPNDFVPERFESGETSSLPRFVYFPFGEGLRKCAGTHFAMLEMLLIITRFMKRFQIERIGTSEVVALPLATLKPDRPILVRLTLASE